jgi:hypothetical protein
MNDSGSYYHRGQPPALQGWYFSEQFTYENDGDDGEHHNSASLADGFLCLSRRLPGLHNTRLLLLEGKEIG